MGSYNYSYSTPHHRKTDKQKKKRLEADQEDVIRGFGAGWTDKEVDLGTVKRYLDDAYFMGTNTDHRKAVAFIIRWIEENVE
jgi:hypothetical protein